MPRWSDPNKEYPDVEVGDRVVVIVMECEHAGAPVTPRLVILIATETGWDSVDETYHGYSPYDGLLWATEKDICQIATVTGASP